MKIAALVLAAGGASRFGRPKQLLEIHGESLVRRACRVALSAECSPVLAVLGAHAEEIAAAGLPDGAQVITNENWQDGMGVSLAAGVTAIADRDADAVLVMLADQPGVEVETLQAMRRRLTDPGVSIVLCDHGNALGPPALFASSHFAELATLRGDEGGRMIVRKNPDALGIVHAPTARWDIDDETTWRDFLKQTSPEGP